MSLANLLRKGGLRASATATLATVATHEPLAALIVARVATVAVANEPNAAPVLAPSIIPDPDRDCWPHSSAMNGAEIAAMQKRIAIFTRRGIRPIDAEVLADSMVVRDRDLDDRRTCLECSKLLRGMQCGASDVAGAGRHVEALARMPQHCPSFGEAQ